MQLSHHLPVPFRRLGLSKVYDVQAGHAAPYTVSRWTTEAEALADAAKRRDGWTRASVYALHTNNR